MQVFSMYYYYIRRLLPSCNSTYLDVNATSSSTQVHCGGASSGSITVSPFGGTAPYSYKWGSLDTGDVLNVSGNTADQLFAGAYTVNITDLFGCSITKNFTITQPTGMHI